MTDAKHITYCIMQVILFPIRIGATLIFIAIMPLAIPVWFLISLYEWSRSKGQLLDAILCAKYFLYFLWGQEATDDRQILSWIVIIVIPVECLIAMAMICGWWP